MARDYIISNPALAAQQKGQRKILEELCEILWKDTDIKPDGTWTTPDYLPKRLEYLTEWTDEKERFVADCLSGLTEREVTELHARLTGLFSGSVLDPIVR
jgi:dGTPase